jgi:hypothetical protein
MKCHEARRALDLFMDGELSVSENMKVLEHLNLCGTCASVYEGEKALRKALQTQLEAVKIPRGSAERLLWSLRSMETDEGRRELALRPRRLGSLLATVLFGVVVGALVLTPIAEPPRALAAELVERHATTRYVCGAAEPDRACVCAACGGDVKARVAEFFRRRGRNDFCIHDLGKLFGEYAFAGVAVWPHRGHLICWSTYRNAAGRTISHALVATPLAMELRPEPVEVGGRWVLFVPKPTAPRMTCVFVFDTPAERERFRHALDTLPPTGRESR